MSNQDDDYHFSDEPEEANRSGFENALVAPWKILMIDDAPEVHHVTRMVLRQVEFLGRPIEFISGYSAEQGRRLVVEHPDAAVIFLDVVMETDTAGLDMVRFIREEAGNRLIRILLRTGQPGMAPEADVVQRYDIDDYRSKADLSDDRLLTSLIVALRSHTNMAALETSRRDLELARKQALEFSRMKSEFLANMSHEIRTPLNAISGMTYLALNTELTVKQRDYLGKIQSSSKHLIGIINDILDFSKIEAGKLQIEHVDFKLQQILDNVVDLLGDKARDKGLSLSMELDAALPQVLKGDPLRLTQVLLNFVSNAVKFTERGRVAIRVSGRETDANTCTVLFEVEDTGIGLNPEQQAMLFQAFVQADGATARNFGGTGLGLVISKQLSVLMGGEVGVNSVLGEGSIFWFTARLSSSDGALPTDGPPAKAGRTLVHARILLVEDNEFNCQVAAELMEAVGAIVTVASNGKEACEKFFEGQFDCILMDMQMPVMDGLEATRVIRNDSRGKSIPIVALTANASGEDRVRCLDAGMNDFVVKPVIPEKLYATLEKWVNPQSGADAVALEAALLPTTSAGDNRGNIDLAILSNMLGGNQDAVQKFSRRFVETARVTLAEIAEAMIEQDFARVAALGHRLKSPSRTVGAIGFGDYCQTLEEMRDSGDIASRQRIVADMEELLGKIAREVGFANAPVAGQ